MLEWHEDVAANDGFSKNDGNVTMPTELLQKWADLNVWERRTDIVFYADAKAMTSDIPELDRLMIKLRKHSIETALVQFVIAGSKYGDESMTTAFAKKGKALCGLLPPKAAVAFQEEHEKATADFASIASARAEGAIAAEAQATSYEEEENREVCGRCKRPSSSATGIPVPSEEARSPAAIDFAQFIASFSDQPKPFFIYAKRTVSSARKWKSKLGETLLQQQNRVLARDLGNGVSLGAPGALPMGGVVGVVWVERRERVREASTDYHLVDVGKWDTGLYTCAALCFYAPVEFEPAKEGWRPGRDGRVRVSLPWFYIQDKCNVFPLTSARGELKYANGDAITSLMDVSVGGLGPALSQVTLLVVEQPYATALCKFFQTRGASPVKLSVEVNCSRASSRKSFER